MASLFGSIPPTFRFSSEQPAPHEKKEVKKIVLDDSDSDELVAIPMDAAPPPQVTEQNPGLRRRAVPSLQVPIDEHRMYVEKKPTPKVQPDVDVDKLCEEMTEKLVFSEQKRPRVFKSPLQPNEKLLRDFKEITGKEPDKFFDVTLADVNELSEKVAKLTLQPKKEKDEPREQMAMARGIDGQYSDWVFDTTFYDAEEADVESMNLDPSDIVVIPVDDPLARLIIRGKAKDDDEDSLSAEFDKLSLGFEGHSYVHEETVVPPAERKKAAPSKRSSWPAGAPKPSVQKPSALGSQSSTHEAIYYFDTRNITLDRDIEDLTFETTRIPIRSFSDLVDDAKRIGEAVRTHKATKVVLVGGTAAVDIAGAFLFESEVSGATVRNIVKKMGTRAAWPLVSTKPVFTRLGTYIFLIGSSLAVASSHALKSTLESALVKLGASPKVAHDTIKHFQKLAQGVGVKLSINDLAGWISRGDKQPVDEDDDEDEGPTKPQPWVDCPEWNEKIDEVLKPLVSKLQNEKGIPHKGVVYSIRGLLAGIALPANIFLPGSFEAVSSLAGVRKVLKKPLLELPMIPHVAAYAAILLGAGMLDYKQLLPFLLFPIVSDYIFTIFTLLGKKIVKGQLGNTPLWFNCGAQDEDEVKEKKKKKETPPLWKRAVVITGAAGTAGVMNYLAPGSAGAQFSTEFFTGTVKPAFNFLDPKTRYALLAALVVGGYVLQGAFPSIPTGTVFGGVAANTAVRDITSLVNGKQEAKDKKATKLAKKTAKAAKKADIGSPKALKKEALKMIKALVKKPWQEVERFNEFVRVKCNDTLEKVLSKRELREAHEQLTKALLPLITEKMIKPAPVSLSSFEMKIGQIASEIGPDKKEKEVLTALESLLLPYIESKKTLSYFIIADLMQEMKKIFPELTALPDEDSDDDVHIMTDEEIRIKIHERIRRDAPQIREEMKIPEKTAASDAERKEKAVSEQLVGTLQHLLGKQIEPVSISPKELASKIRAIFPAQREFPWGALESEAKKLVLRWWSDSVLDFEVVIAEFSRKFADLKLVVNGEKVQLTDAYYHKFPKEIADTNDYSAVKIAFICEALYAKAKEIMPKADDHLVKKMVAETLLATSGERSPIARPRDFLASLFWSDPDKDTNASFTMQSSGDYQHTITFGKGYQVKLQSSETMTLLDPTHPEADHKAYTYTVELSKKFTNPDSDWEGTISKA